MGENEQGGMLRVVVVVGLVALIAAVVTGVVLELKKNMKTTSTNAETDINSAIASNKS